MTFKTIHYFLYIYLLILIFNCNKNPIDIDYDSELPQDSSYYRNHLINIIELDSNRYYGLSAIYPFLYIIDKNSPDSTGNIVRKSLGNINYPNGDFFHNSNKIFIIDKSNIYQIHSNDSIERIRSFYSNFYWEQNYTISPIGECIFIETNTDSFEVHKCFIPENLDTVADSIILKAPYPINDYNVKAFAYSKPYFSYVYTSNSNSNTLFLDIYEEDSLINHDTFSLSNKDSEVVDLFFLNNIISILVASTEIDFISIPNGAYNFNEIFFNNNLIIYKTIYEKLEPWNFHPFLQGDVISINNTSRYYKHNYKSFDEIWLHGYNRYYSIKFDYKYPGIRMRGENFRGDNYNTYCFKADLSTVFFDEYSQNFISIRN